MLRDRVCWYELFFVCFGLRPFRCLNCRSRVYVLNRKVRSSLPSEKEAQETMFLAGLEFALGLVAGVTLLLGVATLGIVGAELIDVQITPLAA